MKYQVTLRFPVVIFNFNRVDSVAIGDAVFSKNWGCLPPENDGSQLQTLDYEADSEATEDQKRAWQADVDATDFSEIVSYGGSLIRYGR